MPGLLLDTYKCFHARKGTRRARGQGVGQFWQLPTAIPEAAVPPCYSGESLILNIQFGEGTLLKCHPSHTQNQWHTPKKNSAFHPCIRCSELLGGSRRNKPKTNSTSISCLFLQHCRMKQLFSMMLALSESSKNKRTRIGLQ